VSDSAETEENGKFDEVFARTDKTGARRQAREAALQVLCLIDLCGWPLEDVPEAVWAEKPLERKARVFAWQLTEGVLKEQARIDETIVRIAENWEMKRMATVDRCVLRMATYELLCQTDTPVRVVINEALEIVKKYSTDESFRFVNGILDKVRLERPTSNG